MKNYLVLYYSNTGNSKFLATKTSEELDCDLRKIAPAINNLIVLLLMSLAGISSGAGISKKEIENYDEIIIYGPIWAGLLIAPLRAALKIGVAASKTIHFAVSCETTEAEKNDKYGYMKVMKAAETLAGEFIKTTEAFSSSLVRTNDNPSTDKLADKIKLTEANFKGEIQTKFESFIMRIQSS